MGNPDLPAPAHVIEKLKETLGKPRTDRYSASQRHPRPAPRAGRLLRAPLRREAQSRHPGRRHARLQGRLRQRGAGDHRAGRRRAGAQSELSDPRLRLPDGRRRDPLGAVGADAEFLPRRWSARSSIRSRSRSRWWSAIRRTRPPTSPTSISTRSSCRSRRSTTSSCCPISPMPRSISTTIRRPRCCRCRARWTSRVEFTSMSKTYSMPGWRIGFAVGNERIIAALARVKSYLDYGAFTPIQVAATAALNGPRGLHRRDARHLQAPPRRAGRELRPRRLGRPAAARPRCSPGRRSRSRSSTLGSVEFSKLLIEKAEVAVSPGIGFGEYGEGYVRIALVENEQRIRQAARNVRRFLEIGAGKAAQRRSARHAALTRARCGSLMAAPLKVGIAGLGTVGAAVVRLIERAARGAGARAAAGRSRSSRSCARSRGKDRGVDLDEAALGRRSGGACRAIPDIDVFVELIGGDGDPAQARGRGGARRRQAGGHRQQGAARRARRRARGAGREARRRAQFRGGGRRRHPDRQDAARGAGRQFDRAHLRHPQRHLQLHPHPHGAASSCRSPSASKEAQRLGYAEADPTFDIDGHDTAQKLAILASLAFGTEVDPSAIYVEGITSITPADLEAADELGYRIKLLGVAVKHRQGHRAARASDHGAARIRRSPRSMGVTNAVTIDADGIAPITLVGPAPAAWRPPRRCVADIADIARGVRAAPFGRPAAQARRSASKAPMQRHEGGYYIRLLGVRPAGHRGDHRHAAGRAATFRWNRSCSARPRPARRRRPQRPRPGAGHAHHLCDDRGCGAQGAGRGAARQGDFRAAASDPHRKKLNDGRLEPERRRGCRHGVDHRPAASGAGAHSDHRDRARDRARGGVGGAAARPRQREGRRPGRGRRHAARAQQAADRRHGGDRRGRARRGADAVHRREGRQQERPEGRHRGRSAGRHHAVRQEHAGRDRDDGHGATAARCCTRPTSTWTRSPSAPAIRRASSISTRRPSENIRALAKAKGVKPSRDHRAPARPAAPCRHHRGGAQGRRGGAA